MTMRGKRPSGSAGGAAGVLSAMSSTELLEHDPRPTFVIDLQRPFDEEGRLRPVFRNTALKSEPRVGTSSLASSHVPIQRDEEEFQSWATRPTNTTLIYHGLMWICYTVKKRWRVISGNNIQASSSAPVPHTKMEDSGATTPLDHRTATEDGVEVDTSKVRKRVSEIKHDWTEVLPRIQHVQFFRDTNWSATPLGPLQSWSSLLRQMTRFLMSDSRPASMFWFASTSNFTSL